MYLCTLLCTISPMEQIALWSELKGTHQNATDKNPSCYAQHSKCCKTKANKLWYFWDSSDKQCWGLKIRMIIWNSYVENLYFGKLRYSTKDALIICTIIRISLFTSFNHFKHTMHVCCIHTYVHACVRTTWI